jgi:chromosomal replication initiation ATPase DnaA
MNLAEKLRHITAVQNEFTACANDLIKTFERLSGHCGDTLPKIAIIQEVIVGHYNLPDTAMSSRIKTRVFSRPRQLAMYLCRELTDHSQGDIALSFGNRDHGTVGCAIKVVSDQISIDPRYRAEVQHLLEVCKRRIAVADLPLFHAEVAS